MYPFQVGDIAYYQADSLKRCNISYVGAKKCYIYAIDIMPLRQTLYTIKFDSSPTKLVVFEENLLPFINI